MKYDKHHIDKLLQTLSNGDGRVNACRVADVSYQTFLDWLRDPNKPEFIEAVKKAEEYGNDKIKDVQKLKIITDKSWQSAAWWLERNYPKEFGNKQNIDHTSKGERMQQLNIIVSDPETKANLSKLDE